MWLHDYGDRRRATTWIPDRTISCQMGAIHKVLCSASVYGFRTLGNSGTFMMLDRRDLPGDASGIILLNLYSDDGLGSTDNSALWDSFMVDLKVEFNVLEKDPDYFLGCAIEWDPITGVIKLDRRKYLRKIVAEYDMTDIHSSPIPLPAGRKI